MTYCPECTCPMSLKNPGTCQNCDYRTPEKIERDRSAAMAQRPAELRNIYNMETPDWTPLERAAGISIEGNVEAPELDEVMDCFMWMCENPKGPHQYKNRDTRNYANLRADSTPEECRREIRKAMGSERTWGKDLEGRLSGSRSL